MLIALLLSLSLYANEGYIDLPLKGECEPASINKAIVDQDDEMISIESPKDDSVEPHVCVDTLNGLEDHKVDVESEELRKVVQLVKKHKSTWVLRFYFGPTSNTYGSKDITLNTTQHQLVIKKVDIVERSSSDYYKVWEDTNIYKLFQFIDEPTNMAVFSFENIEKHFNLNFIIFHPKILIANSRVPSTYKPYEVEGTFYNTPVSGTVPVNDLFVRWELTYGFLNFQFQGEYVIDVYKGKYGSVKVMPGASVGGYTGSAFVAFRIPGQLWEFNDSSKPIGFIGTSYSLSSRLSYTFPGDFLSLSVGYQWTNGHLKYPVLDGYAEHDLQTSTVNMSLGFRLYRSKKSNIK